MCDIINAISGQHNFRMVKCADTGNREEIESVLLGIDGKFYSSKNLNSNKINSFEDFLKKQEFRMVMRYSVENVVFGPIDTSNNYRLFALPPCLKLIDENDFTEALNIDRPRWLKKLAYDIGIYIYATWKLNNGCDHFTHDMDIFHWYEMMRDKFFINMHDSPEIIAPLIAANPELMMRFRIGCFLVDEDWKMYAKMVD